jgi:hypothetical protein
MNRFGKVRRPALLVNLRMSSTVTTITTRHSILNNFLNARAKRLDIPDFVVHLEVQYKIGHRSTPPLFRKIEEALQKFTCDGGDHANSEEKDSHKKDDSQKGYDHQKESHKEKKVILQSAPLAGKAGRQPFLGPLES